ncbi:MAG: hypothetical protein HGA85_06755 [Nanoarchaeota archaeon]|nr:hypothetical protein [Nanoarchaeota archaeon]
MPRKQKCLVVYVGTGEGFKAPAVAIAKELEAQGVECRTVDFLPGLGLDKADSLSKEIWRRLFWQHSSAFSLGFKVAESSLFLNISKQVIYHLLRKQAIRQIREEKPDFIFSTFFVATSFYARLGKELGIPVFGYNSEVLFCPPILVCNDVARFFVSSREGYEDMVKKGQEKELIRLTGFPLDSKFRKKYGSIALERKKLGLANKFTVLLVYGGEGYGPVLPLIDQMSEFRADIQLVIVCGRNQKMFDALNRNKPDHLVVKGFIDNLQDYIYCADIAAGKSGLNYTFESIFLRKPILVLRAMQNETYAAKMIVNKKIGWWPKDTEEAMGIIRKAMRDRDYLKAYQDRLKNIPVMFSSTDIADSLLSEMKCRAMKKPKQV